MLKPKDSVHFVRWSGSIWNYRTSGRKEPPRGAGSPTHTSTHSEQVRRLVLLTGIQSGSLRVLPAAGGQGRQIWVLRGTWPSRFLRETARFLNIGNEFECVENALWAKPNTSVKYQLQPLSNLYILQRRQGGPERVRGCQGHAETGRRGWEGPRSSFLNHILTPGRDPRTPQSNWFAGMKTRGT